MFIEYENIFFLQYCKDDIKDQIKKLLIINNREFIPPLSTRYKNGIDGYLDYVIDSSAILVKDIRGNVIGWLTYKVDEEELYIKSIMVAKKYRRHGIGTKLYNMILEVNNRKIRIKTWSTNYGQIHILEKLGFEVERVIKNDRGNNIDTIYYVKNK